MLTWSALILFAYLAGSVPFGLLIGKAKGVDVRDAGSRNIGATNVGRLLGRPLGFLCFALDAAKGAVPVFLAGWLHGIWGVRSSEISTADLWLWLATAMAALLGHMYSPWLGMRGGKGVATGFGGLLAMWQPLTVPILVALMVWLLTVRLWRYVSLASMAAALVLPVAALAWILATSETVAAGRRAALPVVVVTAALGAVVIVKHRANIARLRRGDEPRIGAARSDPGHDSAGARPG